MSLAGKRILITGAARGIGRAAAEAFVARGARVAIADVDAEAARIAAAELPAGCAAGFGADVADEASVVALVAGAVAAFGGLDGLFNNAGIVHPADADATATPLEAWQRTLAVNLTGVFLCCKHGIPALLAAGGGAIVNNASIVGLMGSFPSQIAYTSAKGGVIALSRELAVAWARRGIRVNSISPGVTDTGMSAGIARDRASTVHEERNRHIPMGRNANPAEIARVAAFLLSDEASYVTGQNVCVDGGLTQAFLCPPFEGR